MADLNLRVNGEDNASPALKSVADSTKKLGDSQKEGREAAERYAKALDLGVDALKSAGRAAVQFGIDSVRAFMESERAQKQLTLVAKSLSGAFQEQAAALAETNLVSDETVMGLQTMLLRYGEAPAAVEATTQAILDYAAATGTDAAAATDLLTRGVESGTGHFKGLGITIEATGNKTKDLAAATAALAAKYGGSGAADAQSLTGQVRGAKEAFGELQETFGGFIASVASKTGVLGALTRELRDMTAAMQMASKLSPRTLMSMAGDGHVLSKTLGAASGGLLLPSTLFAEYLMKGGSDAQASAALEMGGLAQGSAFGAAQNRAAIASNGGVNDFSAFEMDLTGGKNKGSAASRTTLEGEMYGPQTYAAWANSSVEGPAMPTGEQFSAMAKFAADQQKQAADGHKKALEDMARDTADAAKRLAAQSKEFAQAGASIGAAFTNSITSALEQLASGGEQDAGKVLASILAGVLSTVGSIVGNILLPGVGGALGGAIGGLAGAGVRAAANGPTVNINTFDSRSTREFFEADGGRGLANAKRTGRGQGW